MSLCLQWVPENGPSVTPGSQLGEVMPHVSGWD
jgi:hypothetical protein